MRHFNHSMQSAAHRDGRLLIVEALGKFCDGRAVLRNLTLSVDTGEIVGLLGRDGAGKTVCFNLIMGLMKADSGRIWLGDADVTGWTADRRGRHGLNCLPQEPSIFSGMTVEQNIGTVLEFREPDPAVQAARLELILREFQLEHLRKMAAMQLSGGERRRCEIARAMACDPAIMLLDEPFAGIDPLAIIEIKHAIQLLKVQGVGILISDHNLKDMLELVERAYVIHEGRLIFSGSPVQMLADAEVCRLYLGPEAEQLRRLLSQRPD
ncbi:LPS export ABC transporter ATP-binding protein [Novosphingobium sediminicola]|uniref:Lipopolysaccharide export system ATP-binding protein n=1 Tax=Novosphingobium sediminicola TaxID=563162 RepID=A0A7W6CQB2_9SPHN|nr:LPS export ABC transporter ATP-binding protein [Novosphingobium sediminicola]MBB3955717.1 lipopolysaccharide export system ATP-binding protein [Novosphingobium sediminicola]